MGIYPRADSKDFWMSLTVNGKRVRKSTETSDRKLARQIYAKAQTLIAEGKWLDKLSGEDKTLKELFDKYIREHTALNKAERTKRQEKGFSRDMIEFFGDIPLTEVTPSRVSAYKAHLRDKGLSPATINLQRGFLSHAFKKATREWEWIKENPVDKVSREKVRNARDRWLTPEEEKRLLESCVIYATGRENIQIPHYWLQEIVLFALNTGMRMDEILSLEWQDVDLFRKTLTVMRSKNGEKRTIPLNGMVLELLKAKSKVRDIRGNYVFISEAGTKIHDRNLRRAFYIALEKAEITDFRFHDLRHTFATRLAQAGKDLYMIAKLLGHKTISMTQRYSHHYPESLRDGVAVLDNNVIQSEIVTFLSRYKEKGLQLTP